MAPAPHSEVDLFSDESLADPYEHYRALRDLGPAVWLDRLDMVAVPRFAEVREALGAPEVFISGAGVGLNDLLNEVGRGTTLMSDGAVHACQREVIGRPMTPKALTGLRPDAQVLADTLVDRLVEQRSFDAVSDLAEVIPATWVPDLLGWPAEGREHLLDWAAATFNALGPPNERGLAALPRLTELAEFTHRVATSGELPPGSMAAGVIEAAEQGVIDASQCPSLIMDYLGPSLDTTISAIGNAVWLFAEHPDQWMLLREQPELVPNAFNEVLRLESPINAFTRVASAPASVGDVEVDEGTRLLMLFASANRDERRWDEPEQFDITRKAAGHLGFGHGVHKCVGMGLARLEGVAVLSSLVRRVERFELGRPVRKLNNLIRAFESLPVTVTPA
jgi:cytochrome P450